MVGPAIEFFNGSRVWIINIMYHRENGPAGIFVDPNGDKHIWRLEGKEWEKGPILFETPVLKDLWLQYVSSRSEEDLISFEAMMSMNG